MTCERGTDSTIKAGDHVRIAACGVVRTVRVDTAFWNGPDYGWYIEGMGLDGRPCYWKQGIDGGSLTKHWPAPLPPVDELRLPTVAAAFEPKFVLVDVTDHEDLFNHSASLFCRDNPHRVYDPAALLEASREVVRARDLTHAQLIAQVDRLYRVLNGGT